MLRQTIKLAEELLVIVRYWVDLGAALLCGYERTIGDNGVVEENSLTYVAIYDKILKDKILKRSGKEVQPVTEPILAGFRHTNCNPATKAP